MVCLGIFTCCCCLCCCCFCCGKCRTEDQDFAYIDPEDLEAEIREHDEGEGFWLVFFLFFFLESPLLHFLGSIFYIKCKSELNCNQKLFFFQLVLYLQILSISKLYVTDTFPSVTSHEKMSHRMTEKFHYFIIL